MGRILEQIPTTIPGGLGLLVLIPAALLIPLGSSISIALLAGLPVLQYLFLSSWPALRPPKRWGIVRDSTTNVPIPGIFVDLINAENGQQIKRILTDRTGRFGFLTPESGKYWVEIKNPLYEPFRTETFDVASYHDRPISFDIYLRPLETARVEILQKSARYMHILAAVQSIQLFILIAGSLVAIALIAYQQTTENGLLLLLYAMLWVYRFISTATYSQSGHIVERQTDNAVNEAVVQVASSSKGERQFIHSTISDESGRFLILVPPGEYEVIAAKQGYQPAEKEVRGEIQSVEMNLERAGESPVASTTPVLTGS